MPSLQYQVLLLQDMSDKKSPPRKEKQLYVRTPQSDGKGMKRKFLASNSSQEEDDRKTTPKRKRGVLAVEGSPTHSLSATPKTPSSVSRITVPFSERQQLAMVMRMTDEGEERSSYPTPKPVSPPTPASAVKRTPGEKRVNKRNEKGESALHIAAIRGDLKQAKKLIKAGADVNVTDFAGWTPLHEACNHGWMPVTKQLLKAGANVNCQGLENDTPLHDASGNGHHKLVELLLRHGANPLQANSQGKSPIDVAASPDIIKLLRKEIISSSSDTSSIDDARSPTSPESPSSLKDGEGRRCEIDEFSTRSKIENLTSGPSSRRALIPAAEKPGSTRLFLKIQRDHTDNSEKEMDSKKPHYKSYSVTMETESEDILSPLESPISSVDSDLFDPHLTISNVPVADECDLRDLSADDMKSVFSDVSGNPRNISLSDLKKESVIEDKSDSVKLKTIETQPSSPHFEDISDTEEESKIFSKHVPLSGTTEHIPQIDSNHTKLTDATSDSFHCLHRSISVPVTKTGTNSVDSLPPRLHSFHGATSSCGNNGSNGFVSDSVISSGLRWELRSSVSPKPEERAGNVVSKSDNAQMDPSELCDKEITSSPKFEKECRPFSPKVPPLTIRIRPKASTSTADSDCLKLLLTKPALPYVLNPTQEQEIKESEKKVDVVSTVSHDNSQTSSPASSRPSSQGSTSQNKVAQDHVSESTLAQEEPEKNSENNKDSENIITESSSIKGVKDEKNKDSAKVKETEKDKEKDVKEEEKEVTQRVTRSLRSHTQALQQQQQQVAQQQKQAQQLKQEKSDKTDKSEKQGNPNSDVPTNTPTTSKTVKSEEEESQQPEVHPRKRSLRPKSDPSSLSTPVDTSVLQVPQPAEKMPNPFELYLMIRQQVTSRRPNAHGVPPKAPQSFKDYLMIRGSYVLQGNSASTLSVPMLSPPNSLTAQMSDYFLCQEKERYKLRLQHLIEREKLVLAVEQEIVREHGRAARAIVNQNYPYSICTILKEEETYNLIDPEQAEEKDKNVRSRYNGRQFLSWLHDVQVKFEKIKEALILRHHHEAESLFAVQKMDWEWKMKDLGLCDYKTTPVIDELHVPMVQVNDEFDLLPP